MCSTYVSTVLDLCFDFLDQNLVCFDCARPMCRLCSTYVLTVLDLCVDCAQLMFRFPRPKLGMFRLSLVLFFESIDRNRVCFDFARPMCRLCRLSRPKSGMFRLSSTLCSGSFDRNWVCFDVLLDLSLLLDRVISVQNCTCSIFKIET